MVSNEDGDTGQLLSPACMGQCDYSGGGKPPPPLLPLVQHAGALAIAKWVASHHFPVLQGGGEEAPTDDRRGYAGECGVGLPGIWNTA